MAHISSLPALRHTQSLPPPSMFKQMLPGAHTVSAAMRGGGPPPFSLKLIIPSNIITPLKRTRINRHRPPTLCLGNSMGDEGGAATTETRPIEAPTRKKEDEETEKEVTPPPEKPEPGDCCGSGCVRCVWDVYYDELDEYNKLYKSDSTSTSTS